MKRKSAIITEIFAHHRPYNKLFRKPAGVTLWANTDSGISVWLCTSYPQVWRIEKKVAEALAKCPYKIGDEIHFTVKRDNNGLIGFRRFN